MLEMAGDDHSLILLIPFCQSVSARLSCDTEPTSFRGSFLGLRVSVLSYVWTWSLLSIGVSRQRAMSLEKGVMSTNEQTPLLQVVHVQPPRARYAHHNVRKACYFGLGGLR